MSAPILKGRPLHAANWLASHRPGALVVAAFAAVDLRVAEILRLALPEPDDDPRPRVAGPPRRWEDAGLPLPRTRRVSARALREAYADGRVSPVEVLDGVLARVSRREFGRATYSPFCCLDEERALEAARGSEARWRAGRPIGPLDGVPAPIKDEHDMVGLPTTMGTAYRRRPAARDSFLVRRLRQGGAVLYGKTHLPEVGATPIGTNPHYDLPRNVYHQDHGAGGSSTGSAVAVSLGFAPVAAGSDAGGSIRIPASLNGVFGIKPTWVRIGRTGNPLGLITLPHLGPLGASTEDLVDFLEVTASEADPDDPPTAQAPDLGHAVAAWRAALGRGVRGARIGVCDAEWEAASPEVAALGREALRALEAEGAVLVPVCLPLSRHGLAFLAIELLREATEAIGEELTENFPALGVDLQLSSRVGDAVPQRFLTMARRGRAAMRREWLEALSTVDLIALPTTASTAPRYPRDAGPLAVSDLSSVTALCRYVVQANLTGLPAGTLPVGLAGGLPVGLQLVGDAWDEASVLAALAHGERLGLADLPAPEGWQALAA